MLLLVKYFQFQLNILFQPPFMGLSVSLRQSISKGPTQLIPNPQPIQFQLKVLFQPPFMGLSVSLRQSNSKGPTQLIPNPQPIESPIPEIHITSEEEIFHNSRMKKKFKKIKVNANPLITQHPTHIRSTPVSGLYAKKFLFLS